MFFLQIFPQRHSFAAFFPTFCCINSFIERLFDFGRKLINTPPPPPLCPAASLMDSPSLWRPNTSSSWCGFSSHYTQQSPFPSSTHRSVTHHLQPFSHTIIQRVGGKTSELHHNKDFTALELSSPAQIGCTVLVTADPGFWGLILSWFLYFEHVCEGLKQ